MTNVVDLRPRLQTRSLLRATGAAPSASQVETARVLLCTDAGLQRFNDPEAAIGAMRRELRAGRGFAACVRRAPADLEPEHET